MRSPAIGTKLGESLIEVEFYCFDLIVINPPVQPPSQKQQKKFTKRINNVWLIAKDNLLKTRWVT